jgi:hypothetical protein
MRPRAQAVEHAALLTVALGQLRVRDDAWTRQSSKCVGDFRFSAFLDHRGFPLLRVLQVVQ